MAKIQEAKSASKLKDIWKNKFGNLSAEDRRTYIGYAIIGCISLIILFFINKDFGSKDEENKVVEMSTPETEASKYNNKTQAITKESNKTQSVSSSMMGSYNEDEKQDKSIISNTNDDKSMQEEILKMQGQKNEISQATEQNYSTPAPKKTVERQYSSAPAKRNIPSEPRHIQYEKPQKVQTTQNNQNYQNNGFGDFFGGADDNKETAVTKQQTDSYFYAVIKGDHLGLKDKERVALILPKDATILGKIYKRNTIIYAIANFVSNRVNLTINNINQTPLNIQAFDAEDGGLGLQVKESLVSETSQEMVSEGTDIGLVGVPFGNTIKKLLKKKNKEAKIDLLNNQKLILKLAR